MPKHLLRWILIPLGILIFTIVVVIMTALVVSSSLSMSSEAGGYYAAPSALEMEFSDAQGMSAGSTSTRSYAAYDSIVSNETATTATDISQKIIKIGSLDLIVDSVDQSVTQITGLATQLDGYIQSSDVNETTDGTKTGSLTMRIPSASFEAAIQSLKDMAVFVSYESTSGTDVTEEYTDYMARLTTAQAQEAAYVLILNRATTVDEILKVQNALGDIRSEIEVLQGRIKYLNDRTTYSTISVYLSEEAVITLPSREFRPWTSVKQAAQTFVVLGQALITFGIWFGIIGGGLLLPLLIVIWIVWRIVRHYRRKKMNI